VIIYVIIYGSTCIWSCLSDPIINKCLNASCSLFWLLLVSWGTELEFQNLQLVSTDILQRDFELSVLTGSEYPDFSTPNVSVYI
jgi:hypothetical protein